MRRVQVRDVFDVDVDTFWESIFFDPAYNERLYREVLGFGGYELVELTGAPGQDRTRRLRADSGSQAPAVLRKVIGDSLAYTEEGAWDSVTGIWRFQVVTDRAADRIGLGGTIEAEPVAEGGCARVVDVRIEVDIPAVGGAIEKFMERTTKDSYERSAVYTRRFIEEKGL